MPEWKTLFSIMCDMLWLKHLFQPKRDASEAAIAVFTAHKHVPAISTHQTTLQGVVYQLDAALQCPITQRAGIVFIYDMSNSKYSNFDYDLSQKILTLLKVSYWRLQCLYALIHQCNKLRVNTTLINFKLYGCSSST